MRGIYFTCAAKSRLAKKGGIFAKGTGQRASQSSQGTCQNFTTFSRQSRKALAGFFHLFVKDFFRAIFCDKMLRQKTAKVFNERLRTKKTPIIIKKTCKRRKK